MSGRPISTTTIQLLVLPLIFVIISCLLIFVHLFNLTSIPAGLYVDESSIGLNAANISQSLHDEHHAFLPIYFEAFGEYKNPVYIYSTALIFKIIGISQFSLRLTSFIFFIILATGSLVLTRKLFPQRPLITLYTLIAVSTLPWFFSLSRISFEVISLPAILIWALYFIYRSYQPSTIQANNHLTPIISGLLIGLSTYAYSTSRLLSFALIVTILAVYYHRRYWIQHFKLISAFLITLIPYFIFSLTNPGALTARLKIVSFFYDPTLSLSQKITTTISNYLSYFSPQFLLLTGDPNLRHHTGFSGQIFFITAILALLGLAYLFHRQLSSPQRRFGWLLIISLLIAPLAAATTEELHSLRSISMGLFLLLISIYGLAYLREITPSKLKLTALTIAIITLSLQALLYLNNYFTTYPSQTVHAFESYDFQQELQRAITFQPKLIIVSERANASYAHTDFYQYILRNPHHIPIVTSQPIATKDTCLITFDFDPSIDNPNHLTPTLYTDQSSQKASKTYTHLTCY